ncbi:MAG: aminodeoxychorismate/anthranilate synthase component II [Calditrichaeota bacterium]|nr:MAG: aminodeoxychorismate/anthranilate synthase component II [Calditrichota bacterium]
MILFIDNYDSFTYNLVHLIGEMEPDLRVVRNDGISVAEIQKLQPAGIVLSPGPGRPEQAGVCNQVVERLGQHIPILGVCLGHQCIGQVFGARIVRAPVPVHGKTSPIYHRDRGILQGLPSPFQATRYHSLVVEKAGLPACLEVLAETEDGLIMAMQHRQFPLTGVQFHPESILTHTGRALMANWLRFVRQFEPQECPLPDRAP